MGTFRLIIATTNDKEIVSNWTYAGHVCHDKFVFRLLVESAGVVFTARHPPSRVIFPPTSGSFFMWAFNYSWVWKKGRNDVWKVSENYLFYVSKGFAYSFGSFTHLITEIIETRDARNHRESRFTTTGSVPLKTTARHRVPQIDSISPALARATRFMKRFCSLHDNVCPILKPERDH